MKTRIWRRKTPHEFGYGVTEPLSEKNKQNHPQKHFLTNLCYRIFLNDLETSGFASPNIEEEATRILIWGYRSPPIRKRNKQQPPQNKYLAVLGYHIFTNKKKNKTNGLETSGFEYPHMKEKNPTNSDIGVTEPLSEQR